MPTLMDTLWQVVRAELTPHLPLQPPPSALGPALQVQLSQRRLRNGTVLFAPGQRPTAFYAVLEGEIVGRLIAPDGQASVLEHVKPLRLFGLAAFVTGQPSRYEAQAHGATRLLVLPAAAYETLMDGWPGFARALLAHFGARFAGNLQQLEAARHHTAAERLALALVQLRQERGQVRSDAVWLPATQAELAALAGVTRQTANAWLRHQPGIRSAYGGLWLAR